MQIWWGTFLLALCPLAICWILFPWFKVAVLRTITFKGRDYCPLTDILENGIPDSLVIECRQAKYTAHDAHEFKDLLVSFYRHDNNTAVLRMSRCSVVTDWFFKVLRDNIGVHGLPAKHAPKIRIDYKLYDISSFDLDEKYLVVYIKLENKDSK